MTDDQRPELPDFLRGAGQRDVPKVLKLQLQNIDQRTPCGSPRVSVVWESGPWKGLPLTMYCAEPLCVQTGSCTGPRFVPTLDQWTHEEGNPFRRQRRPAILEMIAGSRFAARKAAAQTGREEDRTDKEIGLHIGKVWKRALEALRGTGSWTR